MIEGSLHDRYVTRHFMIKLLLDTNMNRHTVTNTHNPANKITVITYSVNSPAPILIIPNICLKMGISFTFIIVDMLSLFDAEKCIEQF